MIEIPSAFALLTAEALVLMFLVLCLVALRFAFKRQREDRRTSELVEQLVHDCDPHAAGLAQHLTSIAGWAESDTHEFVKRVAEREREIYHCAIEAFVKRDTAVLGQLDHHMHALSEPYRQALEALLAGSQDPKPAELPGKSPDSSALAETLTEESRALRQEIDDQKQANQHLLTQLEEMTSANRQIKQELQSAVLTLDEVSTEYARVFHGKGEGELEESRQSMLAHFRAAAGDTGEADAVSQDIMP